MHCLLMLTDAKPMPSLAMIQARFYPLDTTQQLQILYWKIVSILLPHLLLSLIFVALSVLFAAPSLPLLDLAMAVELTVLTPTRAACCRHRQDFMRACDGKKSGELFSLTMNPGVHCFPSLFSQALDWKTYSEWTWSVFCYLLDMQRMNFGFRTTCFLFSLRFEALSNFIAGDSPVERNQCLAMHLHS